MLNRISSFHNYQAVQNDLRRQETKVHNNQEQMASGKRLLKPSDDPLATHYIQNASQQSQVLNQYLNSIVLVRHRLEHQEVIVSDVENFADDAKRTVMEIINGALSPEDRLAHLRELDEIGNNVLSLANNQDKDGNYIFAGTKSKNQPFFRDNSGNVSYDGDDYQRKMRVAHTLDMAANDPGSKVFMEIKNPFGDYEPQYQLQEGSELLLEKATNSNENDQSNYKVTFVEMPEGKYGYQLERDGAVVDADVYDSSTGINFEGLHINFKGRITKGDSVSIEPRATFNLFDTFKNTREWAMKPVSDASATAKLHQMTEEFHAAFIHLNQIHTDIGARLGTLDMQEQQHEDFKLALAKSKSNFEDLDYAEAVIDFNENSRALQASQQAFGKTKDLTLFNYL